MTTLTLNPLHTNTAARTSAKEPAKQGFFARLMAAHIASRQRKADIEIRRALAHMENRGRTPDYAMLPFNGE
jgi:hypothetical protein